MVGGWLEGRATHLQQLDRVQFFFPLAGSGGPISCQSTPPQSQRSAMSPTPPTDSALPRPWLKHYEPGVPHDFTPSDLTLPQMLENAAAEVPGPHGPGLSGREHQLPRPVAERAEAGPGAAEDGREAGGPGLGDAAQLPAIRDSLFRHAAGRGGGGQHQPAVCCRRTGSPADRQRQRDAAAARHLLPAIRPDQGAGAGETGHRDRHSGRPALPQEPAVPRQGAARGQLDGRAQPTRTYSATPNC